MANVDMYSDGPMAFVVMDERVEQYTVALRITPHNINLRTRDSKNINLRT
jgi:hypothetical protein